MKKILLALLSIFCLISFCGCADNIPQETNKDLGKNESVYAFVEKTTVDFDNDIYTFYHKETKVMYMFFAGYRKGGLIMLVDENGKPLLWQG